MTQNQISAAKVREDTRHNLATEQLSAEQNKINKQHLKRQDAYTKEHYTASDTASMLSSQASMQSANANAMNATTNQKKYQMEYDIEYGWTGDEGYPSGMPLSAQLKNAQVQKAAYEAYATPELIKSQIYNNKASAASSILNSTFGKGGIVNTVKGIVDDAQ